MANPFKGETSFTIDGIDYPMMVNMNVVAEFNDMRDIDFMHAAVKAVNAVSKTVGMSDNLQRAEILTKAVSLDDAATLLWLAAKEVNSQVEFGEIQEGLLNDFKESMDGLLYPAMFAALCKFAILPSDKKKD